MKTYSALFAGFDLAGKGLEMAGLQPINLFEIDPVLAEVGQANSTGKYIVQDVCDVDWKRYERPDVLWASPVCKNASVAKANGEESGIDIATAEATGRAISTWLPDTVFIENVWGYRQFKAFRLLVDVLERCGYWFQVHHLNAADFNCPQTRKRLIVRATRNGWLPPLPNKTPWRGWYQAIEDLIPGLPESKFADWQLERLPVDMCEFIADCQNVQKAQQNRMRDKPAFTVTGFQRPAHHPKAFLVDCTHRTDADLTVRESGQPSHTIASSHFRRPGNEPRAFLVDDQTSHGGTQAMIRHIDEPAFTACTRAGGGTTPRAFIVSQQYSNSNAAAERKLQVRTEDEPTTSVVSSETNGLYTRAQSATGSLLMTLL